MAALGQDHGAGLVRPAPVSPHIAVGHVPVADILARLDRNDAPQRTACGQFLCFLIERRIPQHMAHRDAAPQCLRPLQQILAGRHAGRHRFFQQQIISPLHRETGVFHMVAVLRTDKRHVGHPGLCKQFLRRAECALGRKIVLLRNPRAARGVGFGRGDDFHPLRESFGIGRIRAQAAVAGPDDHDRDWCIHKNLLAAACGFLSAASPTGPVRRWSRAGVPGC